MKKAILSLILMSCVAIASGVNAPQGWHWYPPAPQKIKKQQQQNPLEGLTASQQLKVLQTAMKNVQDEAILHPSAQHFKLFSEFQTFFTDKAAQFSMSAQQAYLEYPQLDYNLVHSHFNGTAKIQYQHQQNLNAQAIKSLTQNQGLFFFYRGKSKIDEAFAKVVKMFATSYHIALIPISVDGTISPAFPDSKVDQGQSQFMGVKAYPALFLVNPKAKKYTPVAYGFASEEALEMKFFYVATNFKPDF
jgi:conjugal transfer pilus assembly protein TraF